MKLNNETGCMESCFGCLVILVVIICLPAIISFLRTLIEFVFSNLLLLPWFWIFVFFLGIFLIFAFFKIASFLVREINETKLKQKTLREKEKVKLLTQGDISTIIDSFDKGEFQFIRNHLKFQGIVETSLISDRDAKKEFDFILNFCDQVIVEILDLEKKQKKVLMSHQILNQKSMKV
jgi:hypothetical protein